MTYSDSSLVNAVQELKDVVRSKFDNLCSADVMALAKKLAGEYADVIICSHEPIVVGNINAGKFRTTLEDVSAWRPYWVTFVPLAKLAIENINERLAAPNDPQPLPDLKAIQSHTYAPDENTVFVGYGPRFLEFLNGFADFCYGPPNYLATNGKKYFQLMTNGTQDDISTEMLAGLEKKAPPLGERSKYRVEWRVFPEYRKGSSYCRLAFVKNDAPRWFPYCQTAKEAHEALANPEIRKKYNEICSGRAN